MSQESINAMEDAAKKAAGFQLEAATRMVEVIGGHLQCTSCGAVQPVNDAPEMAKWLESGFPRCHGMTMLWITRAETEAKG